MEKEKKEGYLKTYCLGFYSVTEARWVSVPATAFKKVPEIDVNSNAGKIFQRDREYGAKLLREDIENVSV